MSFSDEDLKILKAGYDVGGQKMQALIARLEVAEKALGCIGSDCTCGALEAWRKSAGRG